MLISMHRTFGLARQNGDEMETIIKKKNPRYLNFKYLGFSQVSEMRLELTRSNDHYPLKVARLPIPPSGHFYRFALSFACRFPLFDC